MLVRIPELYTTLPRQIVHCDYDPSNILVNEGRLVAVLDFEFAAIDLRALDLAVALSWWPIKQLGTGAEWPIIEAFGRAYCQIAPLTSAERLALPDLLRLRALASLMHRIARYRQGLASETEVLGRVRHLLQREQWLVDHAATLVQMALEW